jgi:hypothetical protein
MENQTLRQFDIQEQISTVVNTMVAVITNPVGFYRSIPRTGGFVDPLIFMVAMGLVGAVVQIPFAVFRLGLFGSFLWALFGIIIIPIFVGIFGFVGGAIMMLIWRVMGSHEPFETCFRCFAYATAITPIAMVLHLIPYLGTIAFFAWMAYLMVIASVEVHELLAKPSWLVFGVLAGLLALLSTCTQHTSRMTPEDAGRKAAEFMRGFQEGAGKK